MNKYLKPTRLEDVLCAIQFLSTSNGTSQTADKWAENIKSKPSSANNSWGVLFDEHPEFFMCTPGSESEEDDSDSKKFYSLVWRRAMPRQFHKISGQVHTIELINETKKQKTYNIKDYGWPPLNNDQSKHLMEIALQLHKNAVEENKDSRWRLQFYVPILIAIVGACATIAAQFYPKSFEKDIIEIKNHIQLKNLGTTRQTNSK